jgi:DNA invertase Pin-like site-specific DNA recombinase
MKVLYTRVSTLDQKTDRQRTNESDFDLVIEDKCSGSIPLFEREGGKKIMKLIENGINFTLSVWSIDRLGGDLRDILNSIHFFNQKSISITFLSQGLRTLDENGEENSISKMIISILGVVGEMERKQILERQREGIEIGKLKGVYTGRKKGTSENPIDFLNKSKNKKVVDLLKKGYKGIEISKILGVHINTITKVKKMMNKLNELSYNQS